MSRMMDTTGRHRAPLPDVPPGSSLDYALRYARLGWQVFPVHEIQGGRCSCGEDCGSPGKHPIRSAAPKGFHNATQDERVIIDWWTRWPTANIAVRTGEASGLLVIDVDTKPGAEDALDALQAKHGAFPDTVMAITGSGGYHYLFTYPRGQHVPCGSNVLGPGLDVRAEGGYIVVEPSTHVSGVAYAWEGACDPLDGMPLALAPTWLVEACRERKPAAADKPGQQSKHGAARLDPEQVLELRSALAFLDPDDYHQWIQVGQALQATEAGRQAYGLWSEWSQQSEKFNAEIQAKKWRSFGADRGLGVESIFAWATEAGWVNPKSARAKDWAEQNRELIERANRAVEYRPVERREVPVHRLPVGELREVEAWLRRQLPVYHPRAGVQAALALASVFASRTYQGADGTPAHLYLGIHAPSLGELRKLKSLLLELVTKAGQRKMVRGGRFSSAQSVYKTLLRAPSTLWVADDYGQMVQFARRQPSGLVESALSIVTEAYGARALYPDPDIDPTWSKHDAEYVIHAPALTMLALLAHEQLPAFTRRGEMGRGALEQILCVDAGEPEYPEIDPRAPIPDSLTAHVKRLRAPMAEGNLANVGGAHMPTEHRMVHIVPAAGRVYAEADKRFIETLEGQRQWTALAIGARQAMRRIAVTLAAWAAPETPAVTEELARWAADYTGDHLRDFFERVRMGASEEGRPDAYERVLEVVAEAGPEGVSMRTLVQNCRTFRALSLEKRKELLDTMRGDELLVEIEHAGKRGPATKRLVDARLVEKVETQASTGFKNALN